MNHSSESDTLDSSTAYIFEKGRQQVIQSTVQDVPVLLHPKDMHLTTLEKLADERAEQPRRIKQTVKLQTSTSFIDYVQRFADAHSTVLIDRELSTAICYLDYHTNDSGARWCDHSATYQCKKSKEWQAWIQYNNKKMDQEEFAMFIEDNLIEITSPEPTTMLEIATSLKAKIDASFTSNIKIDNGQVELCYKETIDGQAGVNGKLEIPQIIKLAIRPFWGGKTYELEARFRYRIREGKLSMWYTLVRPQVRLDHAMEEIVADLKTALPQLQILEGELS